LTNSEKTPRRKPPRKNAPNPSREPDGGQPGDPASVYAELLENRTRAQADRAELQARILDGGLILKVSVTALLGNIFSTYRSQVVCIGDTLADSIAAVFGVTDKTHEIRKIMNDRAYGLIGEIQKSLTGFIKTAETDGGRPAP
jgi:hypothetical protein